MSPEQATHAVWQVGFALFGLALGSFANVAILRLPEDRSLWPRSACPRCDAPIAAVDNVPVLAWLRLGGRCRRCRAAIPPHYPLTELLGGALGVLAYRRFVPTPEDAHPAQLLLAFAALAFLIDLAIASYSDVRLHIIPDQTSIYAVPVALVAVAALGAAGADAPVLVPWRHAVIGAAGAGGALSAAAWTARWWYGHEGLGWGDVKLFALIGAVLGPIGAFVVLLLSSFLGAAVGLAVLLATRRGGWFAFGPSLAIGAAAYLFWGEHLAWAFVPGLVVMFGPP